MCSVFVENHKNKTKQAKERLADRQSQCADPKAVFDLVVKAQSPRRKISTIVS